MDLYFSYHNVKDFFLSVIVINLVKRLAEDYASVNIVRVSASQRAQFGISRDSYMWVPTLRGMPLSRHLGRLDLLRTVSFLASVTMLLQLSRGQLFRYLAFVVGLGVVIRRKSESVLQSPADWAPTVSPGGFLPLTLRRTVSIYTWIR